MSNKNIQLVCIDPQFDFCDPTGSLYVDGADQDMVRLANFVKNNFRVLSGINVTLDSHHLVDIAHPCFWINSKNENPNPFTIISLEDVKTGVWQTAIPAAANRALEYVKTLSTGGRYPLCIWPPHCLIGSNGAKIQPVFFDAINNWTISKMRVIEFVTKGSNPWTEHYSAIKAEVPDPNDPSTELNTQFLSKLMDQSVDEIIIAGQALSHCVANTVRDAVDVGGDEFAKKLVLLEDATSNVQGFDQFGIDFVNDMTAKGLRVTDTSNWSA